MSYSYKTYSDTKNIMKKYVNATEGSIVYSLGKTRFMAIAKDAGAIYKVGNSALVNTDLFEKYLEQFHEYKRPLPKHMWKKAKEENKNQLLVQKKNKIHQCSFYLDIWNAVIIYISQAKARE